MAINPIQFLVSPSVTATNGSDTITVTGSVDCSKVYSGTVVLVNGKQAVEAVSGTSVDGSGNSTIKLRSNWTQPTTTSDMVAFNTIEGLSEAIRRARELVENINALDLLAGDGAVHKETDGNYTLKKLTTSSADTTAGRITKVGDFGIGATATPLEPSVNAVDSNRFLATDTTANDANVPFSFASGIHAGRNSGSWIQILGAVDSESLSYRRSVNGSIIPWRKIYHSGSFQHLQNTSGSTVNSASTVAGSGLNPAQSGTWRNVSGSQIFNTGYGLWELV